MSDIKRIILDYVAGDLFLQTRAAESAIKRGRPTDSIAVLSYGEGDQRAVFAVKFNKDSVRVYPQSRWGRP